MARDFMELNSKDPMVVVKEEVVETSIDSEYPRGSGAPWPSSSKVSDIPHFTSFKDAQEEKPMKHVPDHPGFIAMPSANGCNLTNKRQPAELQTVHSSPLCHDVKMPPYPTGSPFFKNLFASGGQNFASPTKNRQFLGGISVTNPHSVLPSSGFLAGSTETQFNPKASRVPAQLTIFYAGTVHVYDDISTEKAQAIVLLAGNECNSSSLAQPKIQVQASPCKLAAEDGAFMKKIMNTALCSSLSSPMCISSNPICQAVVGSVNNNDIQASKTIDISSATLSKLETPKIMCSVGPVPAGTIVPSAVPQARKASLARFLEMRKERVMNSSPYRLSKKSAGKTNPDSNYADFSPASGGGSNSV